MDADDVSAAEDRGCHRCRRPFQTLVDRQVEDPADEGFPRGADQQCPVERLQLCKPPEDDQVLFAGLAEADAWVHDHSLRRYAGSFGNCNRPLERGDEFGHQVRVLSAVLVVHDDQPEAFSGGQAGQARRALEAPDVVDDGRARRYGRLGHGELPGIDRDRDPGLPREARDDRQHPLELGLGCDRLMPGTGGLAAYVEQVGAFGDHLEALFDSRARVDHPVPAEGIGCHVDDSHQVDAASPAEVVTAEGRYHAPIMLARMRLAQLAAGVPGASVESGADTEIVRVLQDSRQAGPGDLFVAVPGLTVDGHSFAADAANRGAALALQRRVTLPAGAPLLMVPSTRTALAELAAALHGWPARQLRVAGVTGTDGKTTTTHMATHVFEAAGNKTGAMSTVAFHVGASDDHNESGQTTIEAPDLQAWLARMVAEEIEQVVLEVTSHALVQERVGACEFDAVAVTYVGRDHLDYHATWEAYVEAKARLIDLCAAGASKGIPKTAVLNRDDASYEVLSARPIERRWSYSLKGPADIMAQGLRCGHGCRFRLVTAEGEAPVELALPARFNVYNALAAAGLCLAFGLPLDQVAAGLTSFGGVPGRLERVDLGQPFEVYVDFAHSAGALRSALAELRLLTRGKLLTVFGSTARSDHDRPGMGRAAAEGADYFIITTDDPLDEDPMEIAREVAAGAHGRVAGRDFDIILDRRAAIRRAVEMAGPGDIVLLAGKGHERSMLTAAGREPWDERAIAEETIRALLPG